MRRSSDDSVQLAAEIGLDPAERNVDPAEAVFDAGQPLGVVGLRHVRRLKQQVLGVHAPPEVGQIAVHHRG
jgi:hypothetical protein